MYVPRLEPRQTAQTGRMLRENARGAELTTPKWNPLTKALPEDADAEFEEHWFDTRTSLVGTLADTFRIFPKKALNDALPAKAPKRRVDIVEVTVYTDGSAKDVNKRNARAGAGVYFGKKDKRNRAVRVPKNMKQTNQVAELLGTKEALDAVPLDVDMRIKTDSMYVIDILTKGREKLENEGFRNIANSHL
ncbi:RnaseH-domain-containing protein, partial [Hymenopellis radicata]